MTDSPPARRILSDAMKKRDGRTEQDPGRAFDHYVDEMKRAERRERWFSRRHAWRDIGILAAILVAATALKWWIAG